MAVIRDFSLSYQNSLTNQRYKIVHYSIRYDRGPVEVIVTWPTSTDIVYLEPLSASTLVGGSAVTAWGMPVDGVFSWANPDTIYTAGTHNPTVIFTPDDDVRFSSAEGTIALSVSRADPEITSWPSAGAITYGDSLASSSLTSGSASVPGTFAWTDNTIVPDSAGWHSYEVTFTPTDTDNYNTLTNMINVNVAQASVTVYTWPTASNIDDGQPLSASNLTGGSASVAGSFQFAFPSSTPTHSVDQQVFFIPNDSNYETVSGNVFVKVLKYTTGSYMTVSNGQTIFVSTSGAMIESASIDWRGRRVAGPDQTMTNSTSMSLRPSPASWTGSVAMPVHPSGSQFKSQTIRTRVESTTMNITYSICNAWPGQSLSCTSSGQAGQSGSYRTYTYTRTRTSSGTGTVNFSINAATVNNDFNIRGSGSATTTYYWWEQTSNVSCVVNGTVSVASTVSGTINHGSVVTRALQHLNNNAASNSINFAVGGSGLVDVRISLVYYTTG